MFLFVLLCMSVSCFGMEEKEIAFQLPVACEGLFVGKRGVQSPRMNQPIQGFFISALPTDKGDRAPYLLFNTESNEVHMIGTTAGKDSRGYKEKVHLDGYIFFLKDESVVVQKEKK